MVIILVVVILLILALQLKEVARQGKIVFFVFLGSLVVKCFMLILHQSSFISLVDAGSDTEGFKLWAEHYYNSYNFSDLLCFWEIQDRAGTFPILLALLYKIVGNNPISFLAMNILMHNAVLLIFGSFFRRYKVRKSAFTVIMLFVGFFPMFLSYSVILLREMYFIFVVTITTYNLVLYYETGKFQINSFILLSINILSVILHPGMILFVILAFVSTVKLKNLIFHKKHFLIVACAAMLLYIALRNNYGGGYLNFLYRADSYSTIIDKVSTEKETSIVSYGKLYTGQPLYDVFIAFPHSLIHFLFSPFPFPVSNIFRVGAERYLAGLIMIISCYILLIRRKKITALERKLLLLLILSVIPFAFGSMDWFQAIRHRVKFLPILFFIIALLYRQENRFRRIKRN